MFEKLVEKKCSQSWFLFPSYHIVLQLHVLVWESEFRDSKAKIGQKWRKKMADNLSSITLFKISEPATTPVFERTTIQSLDFCSPLGLRSILA